VEMGGFYLDVLKDRLYTTPRAGVARRSAQTAMYHILEAITRWLAPVLAFTAEEIWRHMPGRRNESVLLNTWYQDWPAVRLADTDKDDAYWQRLIEVRQAVMRTLEAARNAGDIGAGLEAEVSVYCDGPQLDDMRALGEELRFLFITSGAEAMPAEQRPASAAGTDLDNVYIEVRKSANEKCVRCWHRRPDVGVNGDHPKLCRRCVENVTGDGETRRHA